VLTHYLTATFRSYAKAPLTSAVAIAVLATGFAAFVAAYAVVEFWGRADRHLVRSENVFVATTQLLIADDPDPPGAVPLSSYWLAQYLKADFPQIERVARVNALSPALAVSDGRDRAARLRGYAADADFLEIFALPFVEGDARSALAAPNSVVLTEAAARTLFGSASALGKRVVLNATIEATVTGVMAPVPEPTHMGRSASAPLQFDLLASRDVYETIFRNAGGVDIADTPENWLLLSAHTYVLLRERERAEALERELAEFVLRHMPREQARVAGYVLGLIPVGDVLAFSATGAGFIRSTGLSAAQILLAIGALVLGAACLNFAHLAVARSLVRAREIGIRKALGASRRQVAQQHLVETALSSGAALIAAVAAISLAAPLVERAIGVDLRWALFADVRPLAILVAVATVVTLCVAAYPALLLARTAPDPALRERAVIGGRRSFARWLVAGQFFVASLLVMVMAVTFLQNRALRHDGATPESDALLIVENLPPVTGIGQAALRAELKRLPQVRAESAMLVPPWTEPNYITLSRSRDRSVAEQGGMYEAVGYDFFASFGIAFLAGRDFSPAAADDERQLRFDATSTDPNRPAVMIVDSSYARALGFATPEAALNQLVYAGTRWDSAFAFEIVGVVEHRPLSLTSSGAVAVAYVLNDELPLHVVRIAGSQVDEGVAAIDALLRARAPAAPINRRFVDDYFREQYEPYARVSQVLTLLSGAALLIALLGLIAMAAQVAHRRRREVGVRKVLGATTSGVAWLLIASFAQPVLVGGLLAWPVAQLATTRYLNAFVEPIEQSPLIYLGALSLALVVGLAAIAAETLRAARKRPADILRA
jgi:putative ABC transport system permease protein